MKKTLFLAFFGPLNGLLRSEANLNFGAKNEHSRRKTKESSCQVFLSNKGRRTFGGFEDAYGRLGGRRTHLGGREDSGKSSQAARGKETVRNRPESGRGRPKTVRKFPGGFESDSPAPEGCGWSRSVPGRPVGLYM